MIGSSFSGHSVKRDSVPWFPVDLANLISRNLRCSFFQLLLIIQKLFKFVFKLFLVWQIKLIFTYKQVVTYIFSCIFN